MIGSGTASSLTMDDDNSCHSIYIYSQTILNRITWRRISLLGGLMFLDFDPIHGYSQFIGIIIDYITTRDFATRLMWTDLCNSDF